MYSNYIKQKSINLRKKGYSYSHITKSLNVPKSTLSKWLFSVDFKPNKHTTKKIKNAVKNLVKYKNKNKKASLERAEKEAKQNFSNISKRDISMIGLGIYIGEGSKTANVTRIVNSNPKVISFMVKWFETAFGLKKDNFRVRLHLYPDSRERNSIKYWSKVTGIKISQFQKSVIDARTDKKASKKEKSPYGTAHLSVKGLGNKDFGVYLHRLILAWINQVL